MNFYAFPPFLYPVIEFTSFNPAFPENVIQIFASFRYSWNSIFQVSRNEFLGGEWNERKRKGRGPLHLARDKLIQTRRVYTLQKSAESSCNYGKVESKQTAHPREIAGVRYRYVVARAIPESSLPIYRASVSISSRPTLVSYLNTRSLIIYFYFGGAPLRTTGLIR